MAEKTYRPSTSKLLRTSFALDRRTANMVQELKDEHAALTVTDYMKGLIALDWLNTKKEPLELTSVPAWIVIAYKLDVIKGKVQPK
jgi:hypothetical protein